VPKGGNADSRINKFEKQNREMSEALRAVKWIGNEGSHDEVLSIADSLDGAETPDYVITALYGTKRAALEAKINAINDAKGITKRQP